MDERKLVRRAERDPWNRLNSILEDADWVATFINTHTTHLPVVPNLRCGAWYTPQALGRWCYFKSTDGHMLQWDFSLKRYNLDLLNTIQAEGGCVVVDSTRRGKSMPDALSKTIPIWCAVVNAASARQYGKIQLHDNLRLPPTVVSPSEWEQIAAKLDVWAGSLLSSDLPIPALEKPLRPLFVTRTGHAESLHNLHAESDTLDFFPVVLVSASQTVPTPGLVPQQSPIQDSSLHLDRHTESLRRRARYVYVQGSGDDEEMWSRHLSPKHFWKLDNLRRILSTQEGGEELDRTLEKIVLEHACKSINQKQDRDVNIADLPVFFGARQRDHVFSQIELDQYGLIIHADAAGTIQVKADAAKCVLLGLGLPLGKKGLAAFREVLPYVLDAARNVLPGPILICSEIGDTGHDLVGAIATAILAACFDSERRVASNDSDTLTKDDVRRRVQWITSSLPGFKAPSRGHLLRVNEVLLSKARQEGIEEDSFTQRMASLSTN